MEAGWRETAATPLRRGRRPGGPMPGIVYRKGRMNGKGQRLPCVGEGLCSARSAPPHPDWGRTESSAPTESTPPSATIPPCIKSPAGSRARLDAPLRRKSAPLCNHSAFYSSYRRGRPTLRRFYHSLSSPFPKNMLDILPPGVYKCTNTINTLYRGTKTNRKRRQSDDTFRLS